MLPALREPRKIERGVKGTEKREAGLRKSSPTSELERFFAGHREEPEDCCNCAAVEVGVSGSPSYVPA